MIINKKKRKKRRPIGILSPLYGLARAIDSPRSSANSAGRNVCGYLCRIPRDLLLVMLHWSCYHLWKWRDHMWAGHSREKMSLVRYRGHGCVVTVIVAWKRRACSILGGILGRG